MLKWLKNRFNKKYFSYEEKKFSDKLKLIEGLLPFKIKKKEYFLKAITHRSILESNPGLKKSNERLEFLGDAVLGMIVAEFLFDKFSEEGEGQLTKYRSHLVKKETLAEIAEEMDLKSILIFDKRYIRSYHEGIKTITADALEALIGAIYLDSGLERAQEFIHKWIIKPNFESGRYQEDTNYKGQLLELTHAKNLLPPVYDIIEEIGPEHDKIFTAKVEIGDKLSAIGEGKNKKNAEQEAARKALEILKLK